MKKLSLLITIILTFFLTACGVLQEPATPSAPLEAVPLEVEESEPAEEPTEAPEPTPEPEPTEEPAPTEAPAAEEEMDEGEEMAEVEPTEEPTPEPEPTEEPAGELLVYSISQDASEVRFELDEDLRGNRITVVGVTNQVAGEMAVNLANLAETQVGVIQINARTLATDNEFRNRAIQNEILDTGQFELITFTPTAVNDLPESAAVGEEITFTIDGDLTVRDITQPVTFSVTATAVSETEINGLASAVISREAYGLSIPEVPNVANVEDEVELYIDFVANAG